MSTATPHSPAPWTVTEIGTIEDNSHNPVQVAALSPRNREANARLIVAAPQLLEALEAIVENADYQRGVVYQLTAHWIEMAEKAIQAARGEEAE